MSATLGGEGVLARFVQGLWVFDTALDAAEDTVVDAPLGTGVGAVWLCEQPATTKQRVSFLFILPGIVRGTGPHVKRLNREKPPRVPGLVRLVLSAAWVALALAFAGTVSAQRRPPAPSSTATATPGSADTPEASVRAAHAELTGILYAPASDARDQEVARLLARYVDFEEMTRRFFGEPCPEPGCVDHWAELTMAQRIEVEGLLQTSLTEMWTRQLSHALDYDVEIKPGTSRRLEAWVRVTARPKSGSDPNERVDLFFVPNRPPYRLVDETSQAGRLASKRYKQYDKWLTNRDEGYPYLAVKLGKRIEREASAPASPAPTATDEPDADAPDAFEEDSSPPAPAAPVPPEPSSSWWKVGLGGALVFAVGVGLGRLRRKVG
jgi:hypothetical protein